MSKINKMLGLRAKTGWNALDVTPDGLFAVSVAAPEGASTKPVVLGCASLPASDFSPQNLASLSRQIPTPSEFDWTVPLQRQAYRIFVIERPSVQKEEMQHSVLWALTSQLDFPVDEAVVSWMVIPTEKAMPNRPVHVYAMVTRQQVVAEHEGIFKEAKLSLSALDVRETALRNLAALISHAGEGVLFLSLGKNGVHFTITCQGELFLDRYLEEDIFAKFGDETSFSKASERIVVSIQRSLDFVTRTFPFIDVNRIILAPTSEDLGLRERIESGLGMPVEPMLLEKFFDLSRTPELLERGAQANYLVALGAALRFMDQTT